MHAVSRGTTTAMNNPVEHRQDLWDKTLIDGWIADWSMRKTIWHYRAGVGHPWQPEEGGDMTFFAPLKRAPRVMAEIFFNTRVFIAFALPTTNRWLYAGARGPRLLKIITTESRVLVKAVRKAQQKSKPYRDTRTAKLSAQGKAIGGRLLHQGFHAGDGRVKS